MTILFRQLQDLRTEIQVKDVSNSQAERLHLEAKSILAVYDEMFG